MDLTTEQIEREFERQVRLCRGIGKVKALEIVERVFSPGYKEPPTPWEEAQKAKR